MAAGSSGEDGPAAGPDDGLADHLGLSHAAADRAWLARLISRRVPPDRITEALTRGPDDIKVVLDFGG
jgi:hypothetical protein